MRKLSTLILSQSASFSGKSKLTHILTGVHGGTGLGGTPLLVFRLSTIFISALMFHVLLLLHIYMFSEEKVIGACGLLRSDSL